MTLPTADAEPGPVEAPRRDPAAIRPSRRWYVVAVVLLLVGIGTGAGVFVVALRPVASNFEPFAADRASTVRLTAGDERTVYAGAGAAEASCRVAPGGATLRRSGGGTDLRNDSGRWHDLYRLTATRSGSYRLTCTGGTGARFALGPHVSAVRLVLAGLGALLCPGGALLLAAIICLVVALRRHAAAKRPAVVEP